MPNESRIRPHRKVRKLIMKHQAMMKPYPKEGPLLLIDFRINTAHDTDTVEPGKGVRGVRAAEVGGKGWQWTY